MSATATATAAARPVAVAEHREAAGPLADHAAEVGLAGFVATATMLFTAFTAAYLIRRSSLDFVPVRLPAAVWAGTGVLGAVSVALEMARRSRRWLQASLVLGLLFSGTQALAWVQLDGMGVFLSTSPHASFFYILTGLHAAHVLGGLGAILFLLLGSSRRVGLAAWYWHFLGALWVYVLLLLTFV